MVKIRCPAAVMSFSSRRRPHRFHLPSGDLKRVYGAVSKEAAEAELDKLEAK